MTPEAERALLEDYHRTRDRRLRNRVVEAHLHLVDHYVLLHARRGVVGADDLRQTALLALIGAVDRFDPAAGASLSTFAGRTIDGELKRYLRDRTWLVRPPRSAQEAHLNVRNASEELAHELGRSPTVDELAERLGVHPDHVLLGSAGWRGAAQREPRRAPAGQGPRRRGSRRARTS
jgi:RNA polymerase sigma-B factor